MYLCNAGTGMGLIFLNIVYSTLQEKTSVPLFKLKMQNIFVQMAEQLRESDAFNPQLSILDHFRILPRPRPQLEFFCATIGEALKKKIRNIS